jgi:hypothetical protein
MPIPNGGLITETNRQYYAGAQGFLDELPTATGKLWTFTFNTDLVFGGGFAWDPNDVNYALNNFKLYLSTPSQAGLTYDEYILPYTVTDNTIQVTGSIEQYSNIVVQLKSLIGGDYGDREAYGTTVEENYGGYAYISLDDIINNFIVAYVGAGKLIPDVKRTDVMFHAKRGLQEFSYDTLKSIKSQELTIPPSLSNILPQDYVNYVKVSWVDNLGVKHRIYPANNLTTNPYENPIQDNLGMPIQSNFNDNIETESITETRWKAAESTLIDGNYNTRDYNASLDWWGSDWGTGSYWGYQRRYGMDPQYANINGWFTINEREGKISFSSQLVGQLIILEYISDGLAYDRDTKVPKMAEEAMYAHILHAVIATRANQPEYLVQRLKQERSAKLRNTKIRLSNIKLEEITQVLRGQSKWIKH